jgi:hypothetical protein
LNLLGKVATLFITMLPCVQWGNRVGYTAKITAMFFLEGAGMLIMAGFAPVSFWITLGTVPFCV